MGKKGILFWAWVGAGSRKSQTAKLAPLPRIVTCTGTFNARTIDGLCSERSSKIVAAACTARDVNDLEPDMCTCELSAESMGKVLRLAENLQKDGWGENDLRCLREWTFSPRL